VQVTCQNNQVQMYSNEMMLNGMVDRRERTQLSVRTQPPKITIMINLLTINLMITVAKNKQKY